MSTALNDDAKTPQLVSQLGEPDEPYSVFTKRQKWLIVCLVSIAATFSGFASNIYFPALPTIAVDLQVTNTLINLTVTSYMIFQGLAPSIWAAVADVEGRRITYIFTFVIHLGACIGLANTRNYATLVVLRCLQSTGSASTTALGAAIVGDVTTRAERGGYMGICQAGSLTPVAVGPIIGGALAETLGWRSIFWFLAIYSGAFLVILILAYPETLRSIVGNGSNRPTAFIYRQPLALYQRHLSLPARKKKSVAPQKKSVDLLAPFTILFSKKAILIIFFMAIYYTIWQMSITVMSALFASIYHLSEAQVGLTYIANGAGSMIGTFTTGELLDRNYGRVKAEFEARQAGADIVQGTSAAELPLERARLQLVPVFALLQCASILVFGWTVHYHVHIAVPITATFVTGWTAISILSATTTYLVDIFPESSASASAALNVARCLLGAGGTAAAEPLVVALGIGGSFTLLTGFMLLGLGLMALQAWLRQRRA